VDHFNFLRTVLGTQGYSGMFFPKPDSPCLYIKGNNGPDGCAIFFREEKFELLRTETRVLEVWRVQSNQVSVVRHRSRSWSECLCPPDVRHFAPTQPSDEIHVTVDTLIYKLE
jgi:nocturnin